MLVLLVTWDGYFKVKGVDLVDGKLPTEIRIKREHRDCPRHPKWTVKTYTEEISAQKQCCWNDQFGQMSDRVFVLHGTDEMGAPKYDEEVRR